MLKVTFNVGETLARISSGVDDCKCEMHDQFAGIWEATILFSCSKDVTGLHSATFNESDTGKAGLGNLTIIGW